MTSRNPQTTETIRRRLCWAQNGTLTLNQQAMILLPRHFFVYIMEQVEAIAGRKAFRAIYRRAGFDGAVTFCRRFEEAHRCTPREAVEGYLEEMSLRGWGRYEILRLDEEEGCLDVLLHDSALMHARLKGSAHEVWVAAMEGAMSFLLERMGRRIRPHGRVVSQRDGDPADPVRISVTPRGKRR